MSESVPDAYEAVGSMLFNLDFVVWAFTSLAKTILIIIWIFYVYIDRNIIPTYNEDRSHPNTSNSLVKSTSPSPSPDGSDMDTMHREMIKSAKKTARRTQSISPLSKSLVTLSILMAVLYSYYQIILHTLRYFEIVIDVPCYIILPGIGWALNRLFLYLYFIARLQLAFKDTFLEIGEFYFKLLVIIYCILMTIGVGFYYCYVSIIGCSNIHILIAFLPLSGFDSVCGLVCLYIFIKKLKILINVDKKRYNKNAKAMSDLKYLVNKFMIIALFAIIFTYFVSTIFLFVPASCLAGIDTLVNVYCLMITTANYDFYYKQSCILCRKCCEKSWKSLNLNDIQLPTPNPKQKT
eukprot:311423_1